MKRCSECMEFYEDEFQICPHCGYSESPPAEIKQNMEPRSTFQASGSPIIRCESGHFCYIYRNRCPMCILKSIEHILRIMEEVQLIGNKLESELESIFSSHCDKGDFFEKSEEIKRLLDKVCMLYTRGCKELDSFPDYDFRESVLRMQSDNRNNGINCFSKEGCERLRILNDGIDGILVDMFLMFSSGSKPNILSYKPTEITYCLSQYLRPYENEKSNQLRSLLLQKKESTEKSKEYKEQVLRSII